MALPERLGRLHVLRRVGTGGFASVWLAHDPALDSAVAVKVLADNWAERSDVRERFLAEARLLRRVDGDGVVRVYDIGELDDGRPWLSMTYADRGTLADRLPWAGGPVGAMALLHDLADAVDTLHRHGIVHRDLAPGNILFVSDPRRGERVLVGDLGLAKDLGFASGLTQPGGTGAYRAPEQLEVSDQVGPATDVYALGVLASELLGGHLTPAQEQVLSRARSAEPAQRPDSPQHLVAELRAAATTGAATTPPTSTGAAITQVSPMLPTTTPAPPSQPSTKASGQPRSRPRGIPWLVGASLVLVLVAAPLVWWVTQRETSAAIETPDGSLALTMDSGGWEHVGAASVPGAEDSSGTMVDGDGVRISLAFTKETRSASDAVSDRLRLDCVGPVTRVLHQGTWEGLAMEFSDCPDGGTAIVFGLEHEQLGTALIEASGQETPDLDTLLARLELPTQ
ncbi:serine/threonine-protein kinase [Ornithinimicrobium faecis]|uniref:serine/threonine-protein kinase n=1 Tax=Ornithinimicrobium faecis TaxID=2934158 RepID=UPI0021198CC7|nr:serine/threonine-protein kinase [Ornithinimicrobium sp. HY1745]